ncbi:caspase family protein [Parasulfuritortus cantonensis]|uniref:Caspase family protein n=1 Tax=Parasulfuritortus cantonensis TaxID=2528202 RepID=A0A4R1BDP4_9PROT|nr:caspase family protein [Parasulfuritortus cantonensis]TCJ15235.1 caspase family protein [Parasulfuritortus cantonensis]
MKRKALLIGNTSGLQGVQVDITRFFAFLKSNAGGAWYDSEIDVLENASKSVLLDKVNELRRQSLDYLIVLFSGHGGQVLRQTVLEINGAGESIEETKLRKMAERQLNVYDCCRSISSTVQKSIAMDSLSFSLRESVSQVRQRFENRIMQAIPQQALLYSCSVGQVSYDTASGGVYLSNLLKAAQTLDHSQGFKLVGLAHEEAMGPTVDYAAKEKHGRQVPEAILPKCLSSQQLVISINA